MRFAKGWAIAALLALANPAWAQGSGAMTRHLRTLSLGVGVAGLLALVGLSAYRMRTRRSQPWMQRALFGIMAALLVAAVGLRLERSRQKPESHGLYGNRQEATDALNRLMPKTEFPGAQIRRLLSMRDTPSPGLRYAVLESLEERGGAQVTWIAESMFQDTFSPIRERALQILVQHDPPRAVKVLLAALRDEDSDLRAAAVVHLILIMNRTPDALDKRMVPAFIRALDDPLPAVSSSAMRLLNHLTGQPWRVQLSAQKPEQQEAIGKWKAWWAQAKGGWKTAPEFAEAQPRPPMRRDNAPPLNQRDLNGSPLTLESLRGKIVLLNFWGTWCSPCVAEIPELVRLDKAYREQGVTLVGLAVNEREGERGLRQWCAERGVLYPQSLCEPETQERYGNIEAVPVTYLLDREGRVRGIWEGPRDFETFRAAIERVLRDP